MRRRAVAVWLGALSVALAATALALPQVRSGGARTDAYRAGPYTISVTREDPVQAGSAAGFALTLTPPDGAGVAAVALPGPGTAAGPGRAVAAAGTRPGAYVVTATFPVHGAWMLLLTVAGPAGHGQAAVPVTAAAPGAIPQWLGWAIGLTPLAGLSLFLAAQVRTARRLRSRHPSES